MTPAGKRSPTPSPITLLASVTSFFNMGARTHSSGKAGMVPVSPTAASSSATGQPRTPPLPELYRRKTLVIGGRYSALAPGKT
ncbi:F-box only protein 6b, isoform CRA_b [Rattus norvegicus]|uniref:F-box only protein 6b, isoform CRA_b n=1 Tax=Rattus norvegicus TaxID=10116 RepID=A6IU55_RAT|nr:F-box only protein 6b, isoform CRA_b [Rattus norvegicus]